MVASSADGAIRLWFPGGPHCRGRVAIAVTMDGVVGGGRPLLPADESRSRDTGSAGIGPGYRARGRPVVTAHAGTIIAHGEGPEGTTTARISHPAATDGRRVAPRPRSTVAADESPGIKPQAYSTTQPKISPGCREPHFSCA